MQMEPILVQMETAHMQLEGAYLHAGLTTDTAAQIPELVSVWVPVHL